MNERKRSSPPGYISSEEAAEKLKVTKDRLYQWVKEGRLLAYNVGNAFTFLEQDVAHFERNPTGRKRKAPPPWRIYKGEVKVLATEIRVQVRAGQADQLAAKVQAMQEANEYVFPGTIARYIMQGDGKGGYVQIFLIWKNTEMPDEPARQSQLALFQTDFADVLDWQTAETRTTNVLTHT
jgi:excisionase family DNA binding protein